VHSQNANLTNLIQVSGVGSSTIPKDSVDVRLAVDSRANTAMQAQQMTANSVERVLQSLNQFNVTNVQTESISLQPVYNYTESPIRIVGFESSNVISYTVSPDIAGQTLDAAIRAGANRIESVTVTSGQEQKDEAYSQALEKACVDAEKKANVVAQSMKVCSILPVVIDVEHTENPTPTYYNMMQADISATQSAMPESTVVAGEMDVTASVQISYTFSTNC